MNSVLLIRTLASVVSGATPLIFAGIGETINEKAGVINLSLDGTILLSAMVSFAVAYTTGSRSAPSWRSSLPLAASACAKIR
jgi:ABC-type uncharacterized transport system permease subunit